MSGELLWRGPTKNQNLRAAYSFIGYVEPYPLLDVPPGTEVEVWRAGDHELRDRQQDMATEALLGDAWDFVRTYEGGYHDPEAQLIKGLVATIERLGAGDRPVPPTRDHLHFTLIRALPYIEDVKLGEIADEILALLSGGVPTEPEAG